LASQVGNLRKKQMHFIDSDHGKDAMSVAGRRKKNAVFGAASSGWFGKAVAAGAVVSESSISGAID